MAGGGKTQTSTSSVQIPPEVLARYNAVNANAEQVAQTPFQAYSSDPNAFVAPLTGTQQQAIGQIGQASTAALPYYGMAGGATVAGMGPASLGALETEKYMSPYIRNVVQSTSDLMGQQFGQQMSGQLGNAIQSGAGWGDRSGIAAANLSQQQQLAYSKAMSDILNQGFESSRSVAQQQQSADLAARQADLARLLQGGQSLAGLGSGLQGTLLQGGQALLGAGTQEQQTQQAGLSALYNQFLQERAYPFQVAQFLGNIAMGTGALSGSTTTTTSPAGFFSGFKDGGKVIEGSYRRGGLVPESMGGHVAAKHMGEGYADGGAPPMDYASMVMQQLFGGTDPSAGAYGLNKMGLGSGSYIPSADLPVGQLMVAEPVQAPKQTNASDIVDMASSLTDTAEKGSKLWEQYKPRNEFNVKDEDTIYGKIATGGAIRPGLASGGMPYDPQNTGYVPDNTPGKPPELLQPKSPDQPESGLSKIADIAKIVGMFMANGGSAYASGGVAGRNGYLVGGTPFASDAALAELARKKREQDILNELGSSEWSNGIVGSQPAPVPTAGLVPAAGTPTASQELARPAGTPTAAYDLRAPAGMTREMLAASDYTTPQRLARGMDVSREDMGRLFNEQYRSPVLPGLAPAAEGEVRDLAAKRPPNIDASGFENVMGGVGDVVRSGLVGSGNALASMNLVGEVMNSLEKQGLQTRKPATGWNDFMLRPSEIAKREQDLAVTDPIINWYREHADVFQGRPELMSEMLKDPIGYYNTHKDLAPASVTSPGSVSYMGGLSAPNAAGADLLNPNYGGYAEYPLSGGLLGNAPASTAASPAAPAAAPADTGGGGLFLGQANAVEPAAAPAAAAPVAGVAGATAPATDEGGLYLGAPAAPAAVTPEPGVKPTVAAAPTDAFTMFSNTAFRDEGSAINPRDPDGGSRYGFYEHQYNKPLSEVTREDAIEQQRKWWNSQGGDALAAKYGPEFAAAYVNLSMLGPKWTRDALAAAEGDTNKFFQLVKEKLMALDASDAVKNVWAGRVDKAQALANGSISAPTNMADYRDTAGTTGGARSGTIGLGGNDIAAGRRDVANAPQQGGLGSANLMDILSGNAPGAENIVLPFLVGLGKMAGSQSRFLGTALLEGIGGGAEAYMNRQKQLADISSTRASALNTVSMAMNNMLIKDASGNVFVPLQGGGYQLLWDFIENPQGKSIMGQQVDQLLAEIGAGGPNATARLQEIIKTIPTSAEGGLNQPAALPPQTPVEAGVSNIVWGDNSARAVAEDRAMARGQNRQLLLDQSAKNFEGVMADASGAVRNAQDMNVTINTVADVLANPSVAQPGWQGQSRAWMDSTIKFLANIAGIDVASLGDMSDQAAILNKLATASAGRMLPEGQSALEALRSYINLNPNMDMPPEAMKAITVSLMQANQQALERNAYYRAYMQKTGGFNMGADQAFYSEIGRLHQQEHDQLMAILSDADLVKKLTSGISFERAQQEIDWAFDGKVSPVLARFFAPGAY